MSTHDSIADLFTTAVESSDEDAVHAAVMALHRRGDSATLAAAVELLADPDARRRSVAADVIGQLGVPERTLPDACFDALAARLPLEDHPAVLGDLGIAFGHLRDPRAVALLLPLCDHASTDVRFGVVQGLMGQEDPAAVSTLERLSADPDAEVRRWATFALGSQCEVDTASVRAALWARLEDADAEVRKEALVGLAERGDLDVVPTLAAMLDAEGLDLELVEAAGLLADPGLHPVLTALRAHPDLTPRAEEVLDDAIARCDPEA